MLDVLVLGPVRASTNGRDHRLGGPKQRALLARLVVARGHPLNPDRLINELWDESPPKDPAHALQARISRLRSALPVDIEFLNGGYRLDPTMVQTDSGRFEKLSEHGGSLLADGDLTQAAEHLQSALELWRGRALSGLPDITALRAESVRLEKIHLAAHSDRIDLDLALGRSAAVLPELHALVEEHPFAERHWGQLMTALYCGGRTQEALEVFSNVRTTFADHLGVEPSGELGRLHTGMLREQAPESLLRLPVATPVLGGASDDTAGPPDTSDRALTSNRPDVLVGLLRSHRALLLTGPAGIGTTHLLRAVAARFEAQHCSAPLLTASPLSQRVPLGVFAGSDGPFTLEQASPAVLINHYARHRSTTVLLVDNVDQLDEASLFVVTQLIRTSRMLMILASRDLTDAPDEIRALYDSGELTEVAVNPLSDAECEELATRILGGPLTPAARPRLFEAANGNPLHLREIITASLDVDRLVHTEHGWELSGAPAATPRLTQLVGERFSALDDTSLDAAAVVAIAGEYPAAALNEVDRRALSRADVVEYSAHGWLRLSHPLDEGFLRARCSTALWHDLTHEALQVLLSDMTAARPAARRRAHILALELEQPIDVEATLAVAEHALGAYDERLALRAAEAVAAHTVGSAHAHRIAGLAASSLGRSDAAATHFETARFNSITAGERAATALSHARHLGLNQHDAAGALVVIQAALSTVDDPDEADHLRRDAMRWAVIAGQGGEAVGAPAQTPDAAAALGLITVGMSAVITGPLADADRALVRLRRIPEEVIALVPGGKSLIELTEIMALSNNGNVAATRHRLEQMITEATAHSPESLGMWEYALGFSELLSGDPQRAYALALSASAHLEWRDTTGLLPAARALAGAAARATGSGTLADKEFSMIPTAADNDPKVVMLRGWADAWRENTEASSSRASHILLDTARWLLAAQHSYFAGMLAHCAVRIGNDLPDAVAILEEANLIAGGGLLDLFTRHGMATIVGDRMTLDAIANEAHELGMATTAADTWLFLSQNSGSGSGTQPGARYRRLTVDQLRAEKPAMALWIQPI